jgi:hypothetical protein
MADRLTGMASLILAVSSGGDRGCNTVAAAHSKTNRAGNSKYFQPVLPLKSTNSLPELIVRKLFEHGLDLAV